MRIRGWNVFVFAALIAMPGLQTRAAFAQEKLYAQTASAEFELPYGIPLAGYSKRKGEPFAGVHDPVGVRAISFLSGGNTVVLASCDLLIIDEELASAVRARVRSLGLSDDVHILLAATHTHSGPGAYGRRFAEKISMGHFDATFARWLTETIAQTIVRATQNVRPVQVAYASAEAPGLVQNRMDEKGIVEDEVDVVAVYALEQESRVDPDVIDQNDSVRFVLHKRPLAVLVNFAAHPTTLGAWNRKASADYPGVLRDELQKRFPGSTVLFFAAAVGDQAPVKEGEGFERAVRIGKPLADRVEALLKTAQPDASAVVAAKARVMTLDKPQIRVGFLRWLPWLGRHLADDDATLSIARVGPVVFAGIPCDLTAGLGREIKAAARAQQLSPMLIGFADDYIGYCLPSELYDSDAYEAKMAFNGPHTGERVTQALIDMVRDVAAP